jgi:hypothetical protein
LQTFPRHNGIGSLPSATNTICSVPIPGFPTEEKLFGIAQYIPANANAVSTISTILFMGEFSWAQISRRGEVYASPWVICGRGLWKTYQFFELPQAVKEGVKLS